MALWRKPDRAAPAGSVAWALPEAEVSGWLDRAQPGERLIYAHAPTMVYGETQRLVVGLAAAGKVIPTQPRSPQGGFDFTIQKPRFAPAQGAAEPAEQARPDEAMNVIYRALVRDARFGRRASSNSDLARIAGLASSAQAAWRISKLTRARMIRTQPVTTGPDAGWRIVTIVATGQQTAGPPSWEEAKRQARREKAR